MHIPVPGKHAAPPRTKHLLLLTDIRLIDFGSATFKQEYHSTVVLTQPHI
ncbi:hypothetical protein M378DRAFT_19359 [Amanita muscaria Koide BX008]|uniref:Uncharacterized protein n=1 Tax=Amanita muscaria (strain Koide BX008) TaxID=946122 RepID=A0A0C2WBJ8_AMAMK|nr:hypothetical protein M378DRAFT_19359 [Amanita muscaria Koide BX008]